jgi:hypothetical protein
VYLTEYHIIAFGGPSMKRGRSPRCVPSLPYGSCRCVLSTDIDCLRQFFFIFRRCIKQPHCVSCLRLIMVCGPVNIFVTKGFWCESITALGKTSIAVQQWTAKQFWVDRQSIKQEDNIYYLEKFQINKLNVYLQFKLNYDVCHAYE